MHPKFSVILPTYNRARYLKEAIDSVLSQNYKHFELLVIDDGSTDETPEIAASYASKIRSFRQTNQGRSKARNFGASQAKGEFLAYLDSDDRWFPDKLTRQAKFLEAHPETSFLYGHANVIEESGQPLADLTETTRALWDRAHQKGETYENWALQCCCFLSTVVIRKAALETANGFDSKMEPLEDLDLYLRISAQNQIAFLPGNALSDYRVHADNSGSEKIASAGIRVAEKHLDLIASGVLGGNRARAVRNLHLFLSKNFFILGDAANGRAQYHEALGLDPKTVLVWPNLRLYLASFLPQSIRRAAKTWKSPLHLEGESAWVSRS